MSENKVKKFVKRHYRGALIVLSIAAGTAIICTRQQKLFKQNELTEGQKKSFASFSNLCTKAVTTGDEVTTTFTNDILGKKVLVRISEVKE